MQARWNALTQPFKRLQENTQLPFQIAKEVINTIDDKIEKFVHMSTKKPLLAHSIMLAVRTMPFIVASQHYPLATQLLAAAIAVAINQDSTTPAETQTLTIKTTHALSLAFFFNTTIDVFQNPNFATAISSKTLMDTGLTGTFLWLANKKEATYEIGAN